MASSLRYECFATTISGLERYAAEEAFEVAGVDAEPDVGKIIFKADLRQIITLNLASRMLHRVFITLARGKAENLNDVHRLAGEVDYSEFIARDQSFAVKGERHSKDKPFTSLDMAAAVGRAVIESFREKTGVRLRVDLDNPDVQLYALIRDSEFFLGLNTTGKSLHRRFYRAFHHRAALHPTIAVGMMRIAGWRRWQSLLDPMCGSGTIPIEAALTALNVPPGAKKIGELSLSNLMFIDQELVEMARVELERAVDEDFKPRITGTDASQKSVKGAKLNAEKAGVLDLIELEVRDVFKIREWLREEPDQILMNPPYGIRMGIRKIKEFYENACKRIADAAPGSKLTAVVSKPGAFSKALQKAGYIVKKEIPVVYGRLNAVIISAER